MFKIQNKNFRGREKGDRHQRNMYCFSSLFLPSAITGSFRISITKTLRALITNTPKPPGRKATPEQCGRGFSLPVKKRELRIVKMEKGKSGKSCFFPSSLFLIPYSNICNYITVFLSNFPTLQLFNFIIPHARMK